MTLRKLWQSVSRFRWRSSAATVSANIRLYGWAATLRKVRFRIGVFLNGRYRKSSWGRGQELFENVSEATALFGRPTILIIGALDLPQCKKYRVSQKVEYFHTIGWGCHYCHYNDVHRAISYLQIATALIFYRVPSCAQFGEYLEEASRLGVKTFYDIDDPIFNATVYAENKNLDHIAPHERSHLLASADDYRGAMMKVDALILSTAYLQALAREDFGMPAYLWPNLADAATLSIARNLAERDVDEHPRRVIIGYASGSRAHDEDFKIVAEAVADVLDLYDNVDLQVIGYAVMPPALERFKGRINTRPFAGYVKYFEAMNSIDINIVPLVEDRFNACKSAIRYIEASLCSVPTVASSVGQFSEIIDNGKDGYLAGSRETWVAALGELVNNSALRLQMGEAANANIQAHHTFSCPDVIERELMEQFAVSNE
ncbi:MAG: glycosyltransferase [Halioglobus sp.]|nr:glycosyltransferase [Halioglobus sp.]